MPVIRSLNSAGFHLHITHAEDSSQASNAVRGGNRQFKTLLRGKDDDSPGNYKLFSCAVPAAAAGRAVAAFISRLRNPARFGGIVRLWRGFPAVIYRPCSRSVDRSRVAQAISLPERVFRSDWHDPQCQTASPIQPEHGFLLSSFASSHFHSKEEKEAGRR
jgi:hypothetical protein